MDTSRVTVVVPTYNEADTLPLVVDRLLELDRYLVDVLVVDDNSPDGTGEVADRLARASARVRVLHRPGKQGLGRAYVAGMTDALAHGAEYVVQLDADGSHPVEAIPRLLDAVVCGAAGVAVGSRYVAGATLDEAWPWRRRALSRAANVYVRSVLGLTVRDATSGFKAWRRDVLEAVDLGGVQGLGYCFQFELAYRTVVAGFAVAEVPIHFAERTAGASKMSLRVQAEAAAWPWRLRRSTWQPGRRPVAERV